MKPLTMEEIKALRAHISHLGFSEENMDEYIRLIDFCAISLVDHFHNVSSVQISLAKLQNYSFDGAACRANLPQSNSFEPVDLGIEGATDNPIAKGPSEP